MLRTLRVRLTLWYAGALAAILAVFGLAFHSALDRSLRQRLDANLRSATQVTALALNHETEEHLGKTQGEENVRLVMRTMHQTSFPRPGISIWDGVRLVAEKPGSEGLPAARLIPRQAPGPGAEFHVQQVQGVNYRVAVARAWVPSSNTSYTVAATESLEAVEDEMRTVRRVLFVLIPTFLLLAASGGYVIARRSLVPVLAMARTAGQISSHNLNQRLAVENGGDELGLLAHTFNRMFERLHGSFDQQRQFMADASHELRTPVSIALTAAQVSLADKEASPASLHETLDVVQSQMLRLRRVVEDMFTLAQADSGAFQPVAAGFYLDEVLEESARAGKVLGDARGVGVHVERTVSSAAYHGDEGLIRQLLMILIDNAVKFTAPGGRVGLALDSSGAAYSIHVSDTGPGIAPEDQPLIFRRFYRADKSRSRSEPGAGGGAGLGLAIGQWIAGLHEGSLALESSSARGTVFRILLPWRSESIA